MARSRGDGVCLSILGLIIYPKFAIVAFGRGLAFFSLLIQHGQVEASSAWDREPSELF